jgi:hypothetical protein
VKTLAYILITIGFLVGAYYSTVDAEAVPWAVVIPCLLVGLVGVALVQISAHGERRATDAVRTNIEKLEKSLESIAANAERLDAEKESIDPYEVRHRIDEMFMEDLDVFVDNRESIGHAYGLQVYANVMTHFATGERYLNRCWSASTDGYVDEIHRYLSRARQQFAQALELLRSHTQNSTLSPSS